ncbi:hypothetical protein BJX65DRAFT_304166 [Aspergillus insuetus]
MNLLHEPESLTMVANTHVDHDCPFQGLLLAPEHTWLLLLDLQRVLPKPRSHNHRKTYLVRLKGPLSSPTTIQELTGMLQAPKHVFGTYDASGDASFCYIDGAEKLALTAALSNRIPKKVFMPTFIRMNRAEKAFASDSIAPFLGFDPTLPHHRPAESTQTFLPTQTQYPVWYFFYATLADPTILAKKLGFPYPIMYRSASVTGGELRTWGGKYKALIDGTGSVRGWAY